MVGDGDGVNGRSRMGRKRSTTDLLGFVVPEKASRESVEGWSFVMRWMMEMTLSEILVRPFWFSVLGCWG